MSNLPLDPIKLAGALVRQPAVKAVAHRGFELRDAALQAQAQVLAAMNLPTAADIASIASRLRSLSQRLELLEDSLSRVETGVRQLQQAERARSEDTNLGAPR
ncbi:MAG TPA: hypothetical protein VLI04_06985 [Nocardioidaceae bacterium]|nr:hypothetical protein [Nocardioidaceae bacterium]